jgi:DNA-binding transcriptional MerR regulator
MYKIGDFSKVTNTPIKTLRYYDEIGLLKPSYIDYFTGYRYYEKNQINIIREIRALKDINLSLKEIKQYLETRDMNIILEKEKEFKMKIEAIKNYVNKPNIKIIEGNYDDYVKYNGLKNKNKPAALEIRDNVAKYLMIFDGEELYSEVIIFEEKEVLINLNITSRVKSYLDDLLEYLKSKYKYVTFQSDETLDNKLKDIREKCKVIDESEEIFKLESGLELRLVSLKVEL